MVLLQLVVVLRLMVVLWVVVKECLVLLLCAAWILLTQKLAQLLPAAAYANHDVPPEDSDEYDELVTHFVFAVSNSNHRKLCWTGALA